MKINTGEVKKKARCKVKVQVAVNNISCTVKLEVTFSLIKSDRSGHRNRCFKACVYVRDCKPGFRLCYSPIPS